MTAPSMSKNGIPTALKGAIAEFNGWSDVQLTQEQTNNAIAVPLYHYTDGRGLRGIIESETIWFTDYRHLNDPSELIHGIGMAHDVMQLAATGADGRLRLFLECLADM